MSLSSTGDRRGVSLGEVLEMLLVADDTVSPVVSGYALSLAAIVPYDDRHLSVPFLAVAHTAGDGRDARRLRTVTGGIEAGFEALVVPRDDELGTLGTRVADLARDWAVSARPLPVLEFEDLVGAVDRRVARLGKRRRDEDSATTLLRCIGCLLHGFEQAERLRAVPTNDAAATRSIAALSQALHLAVAAAEESARPVVRERAVSSFVTLLRIAA